RPRLCPDRPRRFRPALPRPHRPATPRPDGVRGGRGGGVGVSLRAAAPRGRPWPAAPDRAARRPHRRPGDPRRRGVGQAGRGRRAGGGVAVQPRHRPGAVAPLRRRRPALRYHGGVHLARLPTRHGDRRPARRPAPSAGGRRMKAATLLTDVVHAPEVAAPAPAMAPGRCADYLALTKPRVAVLVLFTVAAGV